MFCTHCGAKIEDGCRFCTACGAPVDESAQPGNGSASVASKTAVSPVRPTPVVTPPMPVRAAVPTAPVAKRNNKASTIVLVILGVVTVAAIGVIIYCTNGFGFLGGSTASTSSAASTLASASATTSSAGASAATTSAADVTVHSSLADYSWDDLSKISHALEACGSREKALELAKTYNLVTSDNRITTSTKPVRFADGTTVNVCIADICHDTLSSGTGTAGLTFICTSAVTMRSMESGDTNVGGWASSPMRTWLTTPNNELEELPTDLSSVIVSVKKSTNNTGQTTSVSSVTTTDDKLWLLSVAEIIGTPSWDWDSDPTNAANYNAVLGAEGTQYACFSYSTLNTYDANGSLVMKESTGTSIGWWLRSTSPSVPRHFRCVDASGDPSSFESSDKALGVVLGFCV